MSIDTDYKSDSDRSFALGWTIDHSQPRDPNIGERASTPLSSVTSRFRGTYDAVGLRANELLYP
jgi:hypothetical protein